MQYLFLNNLWSHIKRALKKALLMALDNSSAFLKIFVISYFASLPFLLYHKNSNVVYCNLYNKMLITLKESLSYVWILKDVTQMYAK